jgi:hypothetical protein
MRFKKLRFSVGIALIVFIFVAGDIIFVGKLVEKAQINNPSQTVTLVDPKTISPQVIPVETVASEPANDVQNTTVSTGQASTKVAEPVPAPQPIVVHTTRRTRAS